MGIPKISSASWKTRRAASKRSWKSRPMPTYWAPWPGNIKAIDTPSTPVLQGPLDHGGGPGQPASEGHHKHVVARLDAPGAEAFVQGDGDGGRRGVAVMLDVDHHPVHGQAEPAGRGLDDAVVGLVGHIKIDVPEGEARLFHRRRRCVAHGLDGELVYFPAVHLEEVKPGGHRLVGGRQ